MHEFAQAAIENSELKKNNRSALVVHTTRSQSLARRPPKPVHPRGRAAEQRILLRLPQPHSPRDPPAFHSVWYENEARSGGKFDSNMARVPNAAMQQA